MARAPYDAAVAKQSAGGPKDPLAVSIFEAVGKLGLSLEKSELSKTAYIIESVDHLAATARAAKTSSLSPDQIAAVDKYVADEMGREHIPGLAVGVYNRGQILLAKGYGLANVELNVPVKAETIFPSGSVGKQFVSAAVMMLVEESKVALDDSITKYFPDAPETWKPILIKNLLSHTSGLAEYESPERASYFNVLDLAKWDEALYGTSLLRQSSLDRIWSSFPLNNGNPNPAHYGFGWEIGSVNGHKIIEHGGAWQGFTCQISRYVDDGLTVVVLANLAGARPGVIAHAVAALINPALKPPPPKQHSEITIDPIVLDGYIGKYEIAPGFIMTVTREGDHLNTQASGQGIVPIFPEGERDFFVKTFDAQITFVTDSHGRATEIVLHQNGDHHAKRIE